MATTKITDLTNYTTPTSADVLPIVDVAGDVTKKVTGANLTKALTPASTSIAGVVQLESGTNSTSTTKAATPSAVKSAYDLADAAIPKAGGTFTGDVSFFNNTVKATTVQHPSAASPAIGLAADGSATAQLSSINGGQLAGSRNRLVNGSMAVDQRNAGASQTFTAAAALAYSVDRWYGYCTGANVTGQRVQGASVGQFRYQFTGAASVTAIGFGQRIEQLNSADLAGTTATLSVDLANSVLTTVTWTAYYATTVNAFGTLASPTRTQIATGTFTVNSTVTRYSTQISVPAAATTGIEIVFTVGAQTSGTWTIGNVQLEPGTIATPFERRSYGQELALSQRYALIFASDATYSTTHIGIGVATSTTAGQIAITAPVAMRTYPSITVSSAAHFAYGGPASGTLSTITAVATSGQFLQDGNQIRLETTGTGFTIGPALFRANSSSAKLTLSAEL